MAQRSYILHIDPVDEEKLNRCKTAYDFYKLFNTQEFLEQTMEQTKLSATQKGKEKLIPMVTEDNIRAFEAWLLHSGKKTYLLFLILSVYYSVFFCFP